MNEDEAKAVTEHISCNFKCKFKNTTCNSKKKTKKNKGIVKHAKVNVKLS